MIHNSGLSLLGRDGILAGLNGFQMRILGIQGKITFLVVFFFFKLNNGKNQ